jgi:hypothetical protein
MATPSDKLQPRARAVSAGTPPTPSSIARRDRCPSGNTAASAAPSIGAFLDELAGEWPVGARVRHTCSGWVGTVTTDTSRQAPGITTGSEPAHGLLFEPPYDAERGVPAVVYVVWDRAEPAGLVAWMRTEHLRRLDDCHGDDLAVHARGRGDGGSRRRRTRSGHVGGERSAAGVVS